MTRRAPACRFLLEQLSAYLDGDLPAIECRRIERHARTCARCSKALADIRETVAVCRDAGGQALPLAVRRKARARVRRLLDEG